MFGAKIDIINNLNENIKKHTSYHNKNILVLGGAGIKGICFLGGIKRLEELDIIKNIKIYAGTSVGGLIASLLLIGYSADELYKFVLEINIKKLTSIKLKNIISKFGLNDGKRFELVFKKLFTSKGVDVKITFSELFKKTNKTLILTGTNLTGKSEYFSHLTHPNMSVITCLRITTCIPIIFAPILENNNYYVDGGVMDNFPIHLFNDRLDRVISFYVITNMSERESKIGTFKQKNHNFIKNLEDLLLNSKMCIDEGIDNRILLNYKKNSIIIELSENISAVEFDISREQMIKLYTNGYETVYEYIESLSRF